MNEPLLAWGSAGAERSRGAAALPSALSFVLADSCRRILAFALQELKLHMFGCLDAGEEDAPLHQQDLLDLHVWVEPDGAAAVKLPGWRLQSSPAGGVTAANGDAETSERSCCLFDLSQACGPQGKSLLHDLHVTST